MQELNEVAGIEPRGVFERWRVQALLRRAARQRERHTPATSIGETGCTMLDIAYGPHPRQRLDVYVPQATPCPTLVFAHGGSWISEDKRLYTVVGRYLAANGVAAVLVNYRLPPEATCAEELQDIGSALAWTFEKLADWGGRKDQLFVSGHSAGAHLVSVLASNDDFQARENLTPRVIRGVVSIAGPYRIGFEVTFSGLGYVFQGVDKKAVSPLSQAHPGMPHFLLINSAHRSRYLRVQARRFHRRLQSIGVDSERYVVPSEGHYGQVLDIARPGNSLGPRILEFISGSCATEELSAGSDSGMVPHNPGE
jgi:acetyl esterase/lipase